MQKGRTCMANVNILLITKIQICAPSQHLDHRKMDVIDFEINLCHKRVFTNEFSGWCTNRGREGGLESKKNWSDVAERREKSKLKVET